MGTPRNKVSPYQISAFTEAARSKSFSKAAALMGVTQSSISQHVANLEDHVGAKLLIRRREGLELTQAGRELFEVSDRLRTLEQLVEEKIGNYADLETGHLTIVANAPRPAMPVIAKYLAQHPRVSIEFSLKSWEAAVESLTAREVDIAMIVEAPADDTLWIGEIGRTRYKAFVSRSHPMANRKKISLADLATETVILPEDGSLTQTLVRQKAADLGVALQKVVRTTTFPVVKEAILHGIGVGFMLEDGQFDSTNLVALEIAEMGESFRNCLVTPREKRDLRLVSSFCDAVLDSM